jgi:nitroreductase
MEALEAIFTRRSIRAYTPEPIPRATVETLLRAAMSAPSAGNQQPWQFLVIDDRATLDRLPAIHPHAEMTRQAALAIVVCGDLHLEKHAGYWVQDCSAAAENLLLAAHALGLGAVWTGIHPVEQRVAAFRTFFGMPAHLVPLCLIPIGRPAESAGPVDRFRADRVHTNRW